MLRMAADARRPMPLATFLLALLSIIQTSQSYHDGFHLGAYVLTEHGMWFPEYQMGNVDWGRVRSWALHDSWNLAHPVLVSQNDPVPPPRFCSWHSEPRIS